MKIVLPNEKDIAQTVLKNIPDLLKAIEEAGMEEAEMFYSGLYDDNKSPKDVQISSKRGDDYVEITAEGESVLFMEFGAGVHYNGLDPHPERPPEVSNIGEYGKGKGKQDSWRFYDSNGTLQKTHGTRAYRPMYEAKKSIMEFVENHGKEILTK